jgi:hypothetical protein
MRQSHRFLWVSSVNSRFSAIVYYRYAQHDSGTRKATSWSVIGMNYVYFNLTYEEFKM